MPTTSFGDDVVVVLLLSSGLTGSAWGAGCPSDTLTLGEMGNCCWVAVSIEVLVGLSASPGLSVVAMLALAASGGPSMARPASARLLLDDSETLTVEAVDVDGLTLAAGTELLADGAPLLVGAGVGSRVCGL